jgi:hypothetical protein
MVHDNGREAGGGGARLRCVNPNEWAQSTPRPEGLRLDLVDLRLLHAVTAWGGAGTVGDLARLSGLSPDAAYRGVIHLHGRAYLSEERRRYSLTAEGRALVAFLDAPSDQGIDPGPHGRDR